MPKISVVINTRNEEENIKRCLESVKWADEVIVVDMHSEDKTVQVAKKMGAKRLNVMIEGNNPHWRQNLARGSKGIFRYKTSRTLTAKMRMGAWYSKVVKKKKVPKITVLTKRLK